jgi:hypothetical protein
VTDRVEGAAAVYRELTALAGAQVEPVVLAS